MSSFFGNTQEETNFADTVDYEIVSSQERLNEVAELLSKESIVAVDTENSTIDPHGGWPILLQIAAGDKCFVFNGWQAASARSSLPTLPEGETLDFSPLEKVLGNSNVVKVFFQAKYDWKWIFVHYGIKVRNLFCCQVVERLLTVGLPNARRRPALKDVTSKYLGIQLRKETRSGFVNRDPVIDPITADEYAYSAADTVLLTDVYYQQYIAGQELELEVVFDLENRTLPALAEAEVTGITINQEKWRSLLDEARVRHAEISKKVYKSFDSVISQKTLFGVPTFNIGSQPQLLANLKKLGFTLPDTEESTLKKFKGKHEVFSLLLDWRGYNTVLSRYGDKFLAKISEKTGRLHGQFNQIEADCMPSGELVLTSRGYIPVENVVVGDFVITHKGRPKKVVDAYDNVVTDIYKVTLDNGLVLRTTGNHKYWTKDGWIEARYLRVGTKAVVHSSPERWRSVPSWDEFEVSSWGRVRRKDTKRPLSLQPKGKWGHLKVCLTRNGSQVRGPDRKDKSVHRLVLEAFSSDIVSGKQVRHLNGIPWDNTLDNLSYGTEQDNKDDCVRHGSLSKRTGEHGQNKLSAEDVAFIRDYPYERGVSDYYLAERFGVHRAHIGDIRRRQRWEDRKVEGKKASFFEASVVSVEVQPPEMTYALTVDEDQSHITGGIVTHNTGRMSAEKPNLQQVPGFDPDDPSSLDFRSCFVAREGYKLITADFSQQELRILADMSGDPTFRKAYTELDEDGNTLDVHTYTASVIFDTPYKQVTPAQRKKAKVLNFFLVYGGGAYSLAETLKCTEEEAQQIIDDYFRRYNKIKYFLDHCANAAVSRGYSETISGRKRFMTLPSPDDPMFNKARGSVKRRGKNTPIQGGGADVTKMALAFLYERLNREGYDATILMVVHDEFVVEVKEDQAEEVARIVEEEMVRGFTHFFKTIPMVVDAHIGSTWEK